MAKQIFLMLAALFFAASVFWSIGFEHFGLMNPFSRDYKLTGTDVAINLASDGTINVREAIDYKFKGCYTEVFRETNIPAQPFINSPYMTKITGSCEPSCTVRNRGYEIAGNFGEICDSEAKFFVAFTVLKGITIGSDTAEFHYKIWGEKWERPLNSLKGEIILPESISPDSVTAYFNPMGIIKEQHFDGNILKFSADRFEGYLEVRLLMPKEAFAQTQNFVISPGLSKDAAMKEQSDYAFRYNIITYSLILLYAIIIVSFVAVPFFLYRKYGAEPKISYNELYEREPVKDMKPYAINSLCSSKTGDTDKNAIIATLLDLVRRGHIEIKEVKTKELFGMKNDLLLIFRNNPKDKMSWPEGLIYSYFAKFAVSHQFLWSSFLKELKTRSNSLAYLELIKDFEKAVDNEYDPKKYFSQKGNIIFKISCGLMIALALLLLKASAISGNYPIFGFLSYLLPFMLVLPIIGLLLPRRIFGRFTPEGYEIYLKSMNYKKFMTDMTLLKKYPPASIVIWEEHLVYATLFGVADKVIKETKLFVNESKVNSSSLYPVYNSYAIASLSSANSVASSHSSSRGGGFGGGGVGGGFGGGGGGAR
ncbi:MAG: DUF2207 domain-containing protein [Candidatus Woesearchaeota archaeon]